MPVTEHETIAYLSDRTAIQELVHRYNLALDTNDEQLFAELWVPHGTWRFPEGTAAKGLGALAGIDRILEFFRAFIGQRPHTFHLTTNLVVTVAGNEASGRSKSYTSGRGRPSLATYDDKYVRVGGQWKFLERAVTPHLHATG